MSSQPNNQAEQASYQVAPVSPVHIDYIYALTMEELFTYPAYPSYHKGAYYNLSYLPILTEIETAWIHSNLPQVILDWWMNYFLHFTILTCVLYVVIIFGIQAIMRDRPRFELRSQLVIWNLLLTVFSLICLVRLSPEFVDTLRTGGIHASTCNARYYSGGTGLWAWLFCVSKAFEMVDTLFIVLRKQKLIFLHWYHHLATFAYCSFCIIDMAATARWFLVMNCFIHTLMYFYYALRAMKVRISRPIMVTLTTLQLSQMFVGYAINWYALQLRNRGEECQVTKRNLHVSLLMYLSYAFLFANFFYQAYLAPKHKSAVVKSSDKAKGAHANGKSATASASPYLNGDAHYKNGMDIRRRFAHENDNDAIDESRNAADVITNTKDERCHTNGVKNGYVANGLNHGDKQK